MTNKQSPKPNTAIAIAKTKLSSGVANRFNSQRKEKDLAWASEKMFMMQIMERSTKLQKAVVESPHTLVTALLDAASMGLSLSPQLGLVYLIPERMVKDGPLEVHAKPSYKGMEQAVLKSGTVVNITTELVYDNDTFKRGVNADGPYVEFEMARKDRGELEGGFCMAKYASGERHVEYMEAKEIDACEAAATRKNFGKTPFTWIGGFRPEMQKKCIVRRAAKHWPRDPVIEHIMTNFDKENPMDFDGDVTVVELPPITDAHISDLRQAMPKLPQAQQDVWLQRLSEARGFDSINEVPDEKFEDFKEAIANRYEKVMQLNENKSEDSDVEHD